MHTCIQFYTVNDVQRKYHLCQFVTYSCSAWHCILCMLLVLWLLHACKSLKDSIGIVSLFKFLGNRSVQVIFGQLVHFQAVQLQYTIVRYNSYYRFHTCVYTFANSVFLVAVYKRSIQLFLYCHGFPGGFDLPHTFYHY